MRIGDWSSDVCSSDLIRQDHVRCLFSDHHCRSISIGRRNDGHDRCIHHSQAFQAMHSQTIVDDCQRIRRRPHLAGANEMITAVATLEGEAKPYVVSLQIVSGVVTKGICGGPGGWFCETRKGVSSREEE